MIFLERSQTPQKSQALLAQLPFKLSWSHYSILMRIKNEKERQYGSSLYERLSVSRDKERVMKLNLLLNYGTFCSVRTMD